MATIESQPIGQIRLTRRGFLGLGAGAAGSVLLAACGAESRPSTSVAQIKVGSSTTPDTSPQAGPPKQEIPSIQESEITELIPELVKNYNIVIRQ